MFVEQEIAKFCVTMLKYASNITSVSKNYSHFLSTYDLRLPVLRNKRITERKKLNKTNRA